MNIHGSEGPTVARGLIYASFFDEDLAQQLVGMRVSLQALHPSFMVFYRRCRWALRLMLLHRPANLDAEDRIRHLHEGLQRLAWGPLGHDMRETCHVHLAAAQFVCIVNVYECDYRQAWDSGLAPHQHWWLDHPFHYPPTWATMSYFDMVEDDEDDDHAGMRTMTRQRGQRGRRGPIPLTPVPGAGPYT